MSEQSGCTVGKIRHKIEMLKLQQVVEVMHASGSHSTMNQLSSLSNVNPLGTTSVLINPLLFSQESESKLNENDPLTKAE